MKLCLKFKTSKIFGKGPSKNYVTPNLVTFCPPPPYVTKRNFSVYRPLCYVTNHRLPPTRDLNWPSQDDTIPHRNRKHLPIYKGGHLGEKRVDQLKSLTIWCDLINPASFIRLMTDDMIKQKHVWLDKFVWSII